LSAHHGLTASLISGYRVAFLIGAVAVAAGIVLALVLLPRSSARPELELAEEPEGPVLNELELERQAA
jgi:negative regulator of sigma E activity